MNVGERGEEGKGARYGGLAHDNPPIDRRRLMVWGFFWGVGGPGTWYLAANLLLLFSPDWLGVLRTSLHKWTWGCQHFIGWHRSNSPTRTRWVKDGCTPKCHGAGDVSKWGTEAKSPPHFDGGVGGISLIPVFWVVSRT